MNKIFEDKLEELEVIQQTCEKNHHYTIIELYKVNKIPRKRNLGKVKVAFGKYLSGFYSERDFKTDGLTTEELTYTEPKILVAPRYDDLKGNLLFGKEKLIFQLKMD